MGGQSISAFGYIRLVSNSIAFLLGSPVYKWKSDTRIEPESRLIYILDAPVRRIHQALLLIFKQDTNDFYRPLSSEAREFRLLRILPGSSAEIECELFHANFDDDDLQYEALSYTWGSPIRKHRVLINGRPHLVGTNLKQALQRLRGDRSRLIWIDALCINQSSWQERNQQVQLMRDIYTRAKKGVVIWLGEDSYHEKAIQLLQQAETADDSEAWLRSTVGDDAYRESWINMSQFLRRDYWKRVWVIQEVACASSITILYGRHQIRWMDLVAADSYFGPEGQLIKNDLNEWYMSDGGGEQGNNNRNLALEVVAQLVLGESLVRQPIRFQKPPVGPKFLHATRAAQEDIRKKMSLFDLICIHNRAKATDPRDKIFALVGHAADSQNSEFNIDYSLSELEVSQYLTEFLTTISKSLDLLFLSLPCLPPWTRDYSLWTKESTTSGLLRTMGTGMVHTAAGLLPKYRAGDGLDPQVRLIPRNNLHYRWLGDFESTYHIIQTVKNRVIIKGCLVDEIAAFLVDLTESPEVIFSPWLRCLQNRRLLQHHPRALFVISYLLLVIFRFLAFIAFIIFAFPEGIGHYLDSSFSPGRSYYPLRALNLPVTDPSFQRYPSNSSDWLENRRLIILANKIKRGLTFIMKTSSNTDFDINSTVSQRIERRLDSYWRALVCNRTAEGSQAPDEWLQVFQVVLHGPDFVPEGFMSPVLSEPCRTQATQLSPAERARIYVRPFFEAMSVSRSNVYITKNGCIGATGQNAVAGDMLCVFWGCSYIVVLKGERKGVQERVRQVKQEEVREDSFNAVIDSYMCCSAYLDGYMDGRAVSEVREGKLVEKDFVLH